jgi:hypothetical protein
MKAISSIVKNIKTNSKDNAVSSSSISKPLRDRLLQSPDMPPEISVNASPTEGVRKKERLTAKKI